MIPAKATTRKIPATTSTPRKARAAAPGKAPATRPPAKVAAATDGAPAALAAPADAAPNGAAANGGSAAAPNGTRPSALKRARAPMPPAVQAALNARGLMAAYRGRPAYQQNDYLRWIGQAKLEATRDKRLAQMLAELEGGSRYMNMHWAGRRPRS